MTHKQYQTLCNLVETLRLHRKTPELHDRDRLGPIQCRFAGKVVWRPVEACLIDLRKATTVESISKHIVLIPEMKDNEHVCGIDSEGVVLIGTADKGHELHPMPRRIDDPENQIADLRRLH